MKRMLFIFGLVLSLIIGVSCTQNPAQKPVKGVASSVSKAGDIKKIKITADNCNVRTGCSPDAPVLQASDKNKTFDVINQVGDWYAVKLPDNRIGFVPKGQCKPIVPDSMDRGKAPAPGTKPTTPGTTPGNIPNYGTGNGTANGTGGTSGNTGTNATNNNNTTQPTTDTNSNSLTAQEKEMVDLVNQARAQNNLPALKVDMELTKVARTKSQDMIDNNYFSHNSPTYGSPFDMMKKFGINYVKAGENIAGNQSVKGAHDTLMNSPGHRKNILSPDFTHIGIGIRKGGQYGNMFTQMFISKPK
ncbi:MAG: CAP domain-containing protein [Anaeromicrobium sp.]|jgi:uncharacterized YkwD family protein|uniref:CAP domain-containing protein n=1 Tax=Anaeromicrobium sp. TaxID=1929132 RepID=UPI0025FB2F43|nr:CAP domain-containing protein [Anaeromicrobium sp.]MCT4593447.1 CAP domain-containing protein [Anaeromicrobium sp.]